MQGIRFIMVQSPEPCNPRSTAAHMGYSTIAEIGAERIRRAGEKLRKDFGVGAGLDIGFRYLKLSSSHKDEDGNVKEDRLDEDLLFWAMLHFGLDLSSQIKKKRIDGQTVFDVDGGKLVACFGHISHKITNSMVRAKPVYACYFGAGLTDDAREHMYNAYKLRSPETVIKLI